MNDWIMGVMEQAYKLSLPIYGSVLVVAILALLPLTIWKKTRGVAGVSLVVTSYILGLATWLLGAAVTFKSFGLLGLVIGLLVFGVGVVPLAIIGTIFKLSDGVMALILLVMVIASLGIRLVGIYFSSNEEA